MILENKILNNKDAFTAYVKTISAQLGIDSNWLMAAMYFESGLNPQAKNPTGTATGLIQFTAATADSLGTTVDELYSLSNVQQLSYVYKYLKPYKSALTSPGQLYLAIFSPAMLTRDDNHVIPLPAKWVKANEPLNQNHDENITVGEVRRTFSAYYNNLLLRYPLAATGGIVALGLFFVLLTILIINE